jgi:serine/threonine-protein kinase
MSLPLGRVASALADRYRIERELGAGGMATVYLAHDLRHERKVAIKVLRPELAAVIGAERFLAEIRTTANLQHSHILPLHDSGQADSFLFYVMPFIDGESLRDRLAREKQLPIADAVRLATEIASALDYAHRHGVIHRDIKPENILLHDGSALVADFGIALAASKAGSRMTETGMSLGTPHYMSPEQAMGEREITARSDIYALGAVTYEMLTGDPPFTGSTAQAIVAKVMTEKPPAIRRQRDRVSESLEEAVFTALEKLPADRFASAAEFSAALTGQSSGRLVRPDRPVRLARPRRHIAILAAVGAAALALGAVGGLAIRHAPVADAPPARFEIAAPGLGFTPFRTMSLSPDGRTLVYLVAGGDRGLFLRPLDQLEPRQIGGTAGAGNPQIGLDGREMLISRYGQLYRAPVAGGGQWTLLPDVPESSQNAIDESGNVVYSGADGGMWRAPRVGPPVSVSAPDTASGERIQVLLDLLPGGRIALVGKSGGTGFSQPLYALDLESGARHPLLDVDVRGAAYAGRNTLVYVTSDQQLHGIAFDPRSLATSGEPVLLGGPVDAMPLGNPRLAVSRTGTVVYAPRNSAELVQVNRDGVARPLLDHGAEYHRPQFSPDGNSISVDIIDPSGRDVWVLSLDQGTLSRATFDNDGHDAIWSRDGRSLVYVATRDGQARLLRSLFDGARAEPLSPDAAAAPGGWTRNGQLLAVTAGETGREGWNLALDSAGKLRPFIATRFSDGWPALSPDGRWLAFATDASRRYEVYLQPMDGTRGRIQVSLDGGLEPVWSGDGRSLYYRGTNPPKLTQAHLELGAAPRVTAREELFDLGDYVGAEPHANFDVAADGRIVMVRRTQLPKLVLLQNVDQMVAAGAAR